MSLTRIERDRTALDAHLRLWLLRLGHNLPRPLVFNEYNKKEAEAECRASFREHLGLRAPKADTWGSLAGQIARALGREDPGGLLPLPSSPYLDCLGRLAAQSGLSTLEQHLLAWVYLVRVEPALNFMQQGLNGYRRLELAALVAHVLGVPVGDLNQAIQPSSPLMRSGLVVRRLDRGWLDWLDLPDFLAEGLYFPPEDPMDLLRGYVDPSPAANLACADFPHLEGNLAILLPYLRDSLERRRPGVNVLLYGPPGTGKTELARSVAQALGARLLEVALADRGGRPCKPLSRLNAFAAGQMALGSHANAVLLFDEMESAFATGADDKDDSLRGLKAWLNRSLETNPVPALWITNHVEVLDPAFLRRFDLCLELACPPRKVRRAILDRCLEHLPVSEALRERLADKANLAPAVAVRSALVAQAVCAAAPHLGAGDVFSRVLGGSIQAMGGSRLALGAPEAVLPYRLGAAHAHADLEALATGLARTHRGRLCLYGPPGTGKTAFAKHLAQRLELPIHVRRASDLLSKYVGGTEANLAAMFRQAEDDGAILLLDEADSFLQDRQDANANWEVTQVNEMLTQLESFPGIFLASTNLMEHLDPAALRRFTLKIRFDFLRADQAWELFGEACGCLGLPGAPELQSPVQNLACLTPGDFANVLSQADLKPIESPRDLLARLREEVALKPQGRRKTVGF